MSIAWIFLFSASIFEVLWASSLKFLSISKIKKNFKEFGISDKRFLEALFPLLTYIVFGVANVTLFTMACKTIPLTIAFAVWMGLAMVAQTGVDVFYFKENFNKKQFAFIFLVIIGVIGLKLSTQ